MSYLHTSGRGNEVMFSEINGQRVSVDDTIGASLDNAVGRRDHEPKRHQCAAANVLVVHGL